MRVSRHISWSCCSAHDRFVLSRLSGSLEDSRNVPERRKIVYPSIRMSCEVQTCMQASRRTNEGLSSQLPSYGYGKQSSRGKGSLSKPKLGIDADASCVPRRYYASGIRKWRGCHLRSQYREIGAHTKN